MEFIVKIDKVDCDDYNDNSWQYKASVLCEDSEMWFDYFHEEPSLIKVFKSYLEFTEES